MNEQTLRPILMTVLLLGGFAVEAQPVAPSTTNALTTPWTNAVAGRPLGSPTQTVATNAGGGKIQFAQPIFDFGKIKSGEVVKHSFIFTNVGSETLTVTHVQPQCGCTAAAEWTRKVEPGQTGQIPIQFSSMNFGGPQLKTVTVTSSGSPQPIVLQIKGEIWKPIAVTPEFAVINVPPDVGGGSTVVRIVNYTEEKLNFSAPEINSKSFEARIEPSASNPGKEYTMTITTVPPLPQGNVQGQITVKTGSTNLPVVTVRAWANVQPALVVLPGQITLQAGPLPNAVTPSVLIQNNSTNALTLSEPSVNAADVKLDIRETQPGKQFSVALTFPKGYTIPQGEQVVFTAKSSHASMPNIRVPIAQMPRALVPVSHPQSHSSVAPAAAPAVVTH